MNDTWPGSVSQLDIDLPKELDFGNLVLSSTVTRCKEGKQFTCCITLPYPSKHHGTVACGEKNMSIYYAVRYALANSQFTDVKMCVEKHDSNINFCETLPHSSVSLNASAGIVAHKVDVYYMLK